MDFKNFTNNSLPSMSMELKDVFVHSQNNNNNAAGGVLEAPVQSHSSEVAPISPDTLTFLDNFLLEEILGNSPPTVDLPTIKIVPSQKERGVPYFVDEKNSILTTKRQEGVTVRVEDFTAAHTVYITLRYTDADYVNNIVTCGNCAHSYKGCSAAIDHTSANFCIKSEDCSVDYDIIPDPQGLGMGHPTGVLQAAANSNKNYMDFRVAFKCWNSCGSHHKFGNARTLIVQVLQDGNLVSSAQWKLRVCASAKRDHELSEKRCTTSNSGVKRSLFSQTGDRSTGKKVKKENLDEPTVLFVNEETIINHTNDVTSIIGDDGIFEPSSSSKSVVKREQQQCPTEENTFVCDQSPTIESEECEDEGIPSPLFVQMKNNEDVNLLLQFVKRLGGQLSILPVLSN